LLTLQFPTARRHSFRRKASNALHVLTPHRSLDQVAKRTGLKIGNLRSEAITRLITQPLAPAHQRHTSVAKKSVARGHLCRRRADSTTTRMQQLRRSSSP
jgi:hypothetical protein